MVNKNNKRIKTGIIVVALAATFAAPSTFGMADAINASLEAEEIATSPLKVECAIPGPVRGDTGPGETGVFAACSTTANSNSGLLLVEYKYCYEGQTNDSEATITTLINSVSDENSFKTPYTGGSGIDKCSTNDVSTYGQHAFTLVWVGGGSNHTLRWDYENGDWATWIADIKVTQITGNPWSW